MKKKKKNIKIRNSLYDINNFYSCNLNKIEERRDYSIIRIDTPKFRELDANNSKDLLLFLFQSMHDELNYYGDQKLSLIGTYNQSIPQDALNLFLNTNYSLNLSIFSHLFFGICESKIKCEKCATIF